MLSIRKNDKVKILWGKDRNKEGEVVMVDPAKGRLIVAKLNLSKRHSRPAGQTDPGGIKDKEQCEGPSLYYSRQEASSTVCTLMCGEDFGIL